MDLLSKNLRNNSYSKAKEAGIKFRKYSLKVIKKGYTEYGFSVKLDNPGWKLGIDDTSQHRDIIE